MSKKRGVSEEFRRWINKYILLNRIPIYKMASELHISPRTIYRHLDGTINPTFPYVLAYCWYFNTYYGKAEIPLEVWKLVEEGV